MNNSKIIDFFCFAAVFFLGVCLWARVYFLGQRGQVTIEKVGKIAGGGFHAEPYTSIMLAVTCTAAFIFLVYKKVKKNEN